MPPYLSTKQAPPWILDFAIPSPKSSFWTQISQRKFEPNERDKRKIVVKLDVRSVFLRWLVSDQFGYLTFRASSKIWFVWTAKKNGSHARMFFTTRFRSNPLQSDVNRPHCSFVCAVQQIFYMFECNYTNYTD